MVRKATENLCNVTALRKAARHVSQFYDTALADPRLGQRALESQVPGLDHALDTAELAGLGGAFRGPEGRFGVLDVALLRRWAAWEARFGIVKTPPDVAQTFDTRFAPTARGAS